MVEPTVAPPAGSASLGRLVAFRTGGGATFEAALGPVLAETPTTVLQEASVREGEGAAELPGRIVVKRGREPADFGRLDLEQVACERLEHPTLARYFGASRTPELGTALAFERLGGNPLLLLSAPGARPSFRDPGATHYPLPPGIALELAFDALLALEHVHARGFVHGGVTLTNLRVRLPAGLEGEDVLEQLAAGAYRGVLAGLGGARELTFLESLRAGQADGELTPRLPDALAAPETLLERAELGGQRIYSQAMDAYAFGLLFYTLLTGRTPYDHLVAPHELAHTHVLLELKLRETRGEVSPVDQAALRDLPLHDSPFVAPAAEAWPVFHGTVRHVIARCLDPAPERRLSAAATRALFRSELEVHEGLTDSPRPWVQHLFQWLPGSNRLRGDRPARGLWVREEDDELVVEVLAGRGGRRADPARELPAHLLDLPEDADPGTTIAIRASAVAAAPRAPERRRRIDPPTPLRELLRAFRAGEPLPIKGPCLLTNTALDRTSLANTRVYALGTASAWVSVSDGVVHEQLRLSVGRTAESDIVLSDPLVSKKHAALGFDRRFGQWYVEDLRSVNGSAMDGRPLTPRQRTRIRKGGAKLLLGGAAELTYMNVDELRSFLSVVLDAVTRAATAAPASPAPSDLLDELPGGSIAASPARRHAEPTRRVARPSRSQPKFPLVRADSAEPEWAALARRLAPHADGGAQFRIVLTGAIVEQARTVAEAAAILRDAGADVIRIEAEHPTHRVVVFSRDG